jgi:hypothetical protein
MKKIILTLAAIVTTAFSYAQTADEVIDKYYQAMGGKDKWLNLNSMTQTAELNIQGSTVNLKMFAENNKKFKTEISFQGMLGYDLVTSTEGWMYMPFQGQMKAEPMTKEQVEKRASQLDIQGDLLDYKKKGSTVEYLGKEDLDGTDCFKIKLTLKNGNIYNYYFDASNYYLIKQISKIQMDGKEMEDATEFSNYQKTPEGLLFPMGISGGNGPLKITKIEVNPKIDPKVFEATNKQ